jgi:hypothetical protein
MITANQDHIEILPMSLVQALSPADIATYSTQLASTIEAAKKTPGYSFSLLTDVQKDLLSPSEYYSYMMNLSTLNQQEQKNLAYISAYSALSAFYVQASQSTITGISSSTYGDTLLQSSYAAQIEEQQSRYNSTMSTVTGLQAVVDAADRDLLTTNATLSNLQRTVSENSDALLQEQLATASTNPAYAAKLSAYQTALANAQVTRTQLQDASAALNTAAALSTSRYAEYQAATTALQDISGSLAAAAAAIPALRQSALELSGQLVSTIAATTVLDAASTIAATNRAYAIQNSTYGGNVLLEANAVTAYGNAVAQYNTAAAQGSATPASKAALDLATQNVEKARKIKDDFAASNALLKARLAEAATSMISSNLSTNSTVIKAFTASIIQYSTDASNAYSTARVALKQRDAFNLEATTKRNIATTNISAYSTTLLAARELRIDASGAALVASMKKADVTAAQSTVTGLNNTIAVSDLASAAFSRMAASHAAKAATAETLLKSISTQYEASKVTASAAAATAVQAQISLTQSTTPMQAGYYTLAGLNTVLAETNAATAVATEKRLRGEYGMKEAAFREERLARGRDIVAIGRIIPYISSCEALNTARSSILIALQSSLGLTTSLTPYSISGDRVKGEMRVLGDSLTSLQSYIGTLDASNTVINTTLQAAMQRYSDTSGAMMTAQAAYIAAAASGVYNESAINAATVAFQSARSAYFAAVSMRDALAVEINAQKTAAAATQASIDALNTQLQGITQFSEPIQSSIQALQVQFEPLRTQVSSLQSTIDGGVVAELSVAAREKITAAIGVASAAV